MKLTVTNTLSALFIGYMSYTLWTIYSMFSPNLCKHTSLTCIKPYVGNFRLQLYTSLSNELKSEKQLRSLWDFDNFSINDLATKSLNVSVPPKTRRNGTLYIYAFVIPKSSSSPFSTKYVTFTQSSLTTFMVPQSTFFSLLQGENKSAPTQDSTRPFTHWRTKLTVNVLAGDVVLDRTQVPAEIYPHLRIVENNQYLPIVHIDELNYRVRDLQLVNSTSSEMPLDVTYSPISVGKLRLWIQFQQSLRTLETLGFSEKDIDEVKGIFADTNLYFLLLTFAVSAIHLLFDALAFKNDISYWKQRRTMIGLSTRAVVWRCVSTIIIFLYLYDAEASLLVLIPTGIGSFIEIWKVKKALRVKLLWAGRWPTVEFGLPSKQEQETQQFDSQAMSYLSLLIYPLCIGGAIYSLFYVQHKSWVSWTLQSLVNGVYAFGFLFMLPQLFVNYKMKSVAHLPWRAFMYKAFNTFIDDIFAFIITMPTSHRLACFRDDVVFVVYLYQRWLYPVDKKRVNEYGMSFEQDGEKSDKKKLQ